MDAEGTVDRQAKPPDDDGSVQRRPVTTLVSLFLPAAHGIWVAVLLYFIFLGDDAFMRTLHGLATLSAILSPFLFIANVVVLAELLSPDDRREMQLSWAVLIPAAFLNAVSALSHLVFAIFLVVFGSMIGAFLNPG